MTHIAFVTLLLGLLYGPQPVELNVTGPAARVELQIDGHIAAVMTSPPWRTMIDLGSRLRPHRVVALAFDADGNERARAERTVNLPHSMSQAQLVLERDARGRPAGVQILWHSLEQERPRRVRLTLDGKALEVDARLHAVLPPADLAQPHVLQVRATAPSISAETEIAFGGGLEDQSGAHLTPIPVRILRTGPTAASADFASVLRVGDTPARVVAVEQSAASIVVVRRPLPIEASMRLGRSAYTTFSRTWTTVEVRRDKPAITFIWPVAKRSRASVTVDLLRWTGEFEFSGEEAFKGALAHIGGPQAARLRYTDAVAVAGLRAMSSRAPRAVILLLGQGARDASDMRPQQVREYLRCIGVPLYVWSLGTLEDAGGWGDAVDVSEPRNFHKAFEALQADLQSQRIVWVEGDRLPSDVRAAGDTVETLAQP